MHYSNGGGDEFISPARLEFYLHHVLRNWFPFLSDDTVLVQDGEAVYIDCGTEFTSGLPNRGMGQQFFNRSIQLDFCAISPNQVRYFSEWMIIKHYSINLTSISSLLIAIACEPGMNNWLDYKVAMHCQWFGTCRVDLTTLEAMVEQGLQKPTDESHCIANQRWKAPLSNL